MEVYFNELSLPSETELKYDDFIRFIDLYRALKTQKIGVCRIDNKSRETIRSYSRNIPREGMEFLYAFLQPPIENDAIEARQDIFLASRWLFQGRECVGLAYASITDSMALSTGDDLWDKAILNITKDEASVEVRNLYSIDNLNSHLEWLENQREVELIISDISPEKKKIDLRHDHGQDVLLDFSRKLLRSKYVLEVVNSIGFQSNNRRFIHKVKADGIIEIVLPWTDQGLGVAVKTTGRSLRETQKIAEILQFEYGVK